ncbi:hypothetical protein BKA65DRAFT_230529 [Rhexocercosporidium sp. MPI-PUGE-AT-0058]|nr:hypothetical protein BKA65DRAFT_230529 [Rhexocercosporidium sp. MPI-PUGE-AT-0058]
MIIGGPGFVQYLISLQGSSKGITALANEQPICAQGGLAAPQGGRMGSQGPAGGAGGQGELRLRLSQAKAKGGLRVRPSQPGEAVEPGQSGVSAQRRPSCDPCIHCPPSKSPVCNDAGIQLYSGRTGTGFWDCVWLCIWTEQTEAQPQPQSLESTCKSSSSPTALMSVILYCKLRKKTMGTQTAPSFYHRVPSGVSVVNSPGLTFLVVHCKLPARQRHIQLTGTRQSVSQAQTDRQEWNVGRGVKECGSRAGWVASPIIQTDSTAKKKNNTSLCQLYTAHPSTCRSAEAALYQQFHSPNPQDLDPVACFFLWGDAMRYASEAANCAVYGQPNVGENANTARRASPHPATTSRLPAAAS